MGFDTTHQGDQHTKAMPALPQVKQRETGVSPLPTLAITEGSSLRRPTSNALRLGGMSVRAIQGPREGRLVRETRNELHVHRRKGAVGPAGSCSLPIALS